MQKLIALAAVAVLGGCAGVGTADFAHEGHTILTAEPRAAVSAALDEEQPLISWGARGGVVLYSAGDVKPRVTVGGYGRLLEDEAKRVEVAIEFTPDIEHIDRNNLYVLFAADYVGFVGEGGFYWKAGGNGIYEMQDEKQFFVIGLEGGAGFWFPVGEEEAGTALAVSVVLQIPLAVVGGEVNSGALIAITCGYEF